MYPNGHNILVADHDPARRRLIERVLSTEGFGVTAAAEGLGAIRAAGQKPFSLILAALDLPGTLDGAATVRQVRMRQPRLKALFTGNGPLLQRRSPADFSLGEFDDLIPAPFRRRELLGCVFELLQREFVPGADEFGRYSRTALQLR